MPRSWCAVPEYSLTDPLFKALTMDQVLEETGRSARTVQRWVKDEKLPYYTSSNGERIFVLRDVLTLEAKMAQAATRGRPGARPPTL